MERIVWFIIGIISVLLLPWWLTLAVLIFGFLYFPRYYEGVGLGLLYDSLYFVPHHEMGIPVWFFGSLIAFFIIYYIKPALR